MSREGPGSPTANRGGAGRRDRPVDHHDGRENDDDSGSPSYRRVRDRPRGGGYVAHCNVAGATDPHAVASLTTTRENAGCASAAPRGERGYCNRADVITS